MRLLQKSIGVEMSIDAATNNVADIVAGNPAIVRILTERYLNTDK